MERPFLGSVAFGSLPWYSVIILIGFMVGGWFALRVESKYTLPKDTMIDFMLLAIPLSIIGARLYYVAFQWDYYKDDFLRALNIREGGLAVYGGIIMGFVAALIIANVKKVSLFKLLSALAPPLAIGQSIGRWGNYANMEAYGLPITIPALQFFPYGVEIFINGQWSWFQATFFYESISCFAIFVILKLIEKKQTDTEEKRNSGMVFYFYLLLYGIERAFVEGLRQDSLMFGSVRVSQILSLALAAFALIMITRIVIKGRCARAV